MANITRTELAGLYAGNNYCLAMKRQTSVLLGGIRLLITNPAGSGRNMLITSAKIYSWGSALGTLSIYRNPTSGTPTTSPTFAQVSVTNLNYGSVNTSVIGPATKFLIDPVAIQMTSATEAQKLPVNLNTPGEFDPPAKFIPPGFSMGLVFSGAVIDVSCEIVFTEQLI